MPLFRFLLLGSLLGTLASPAGAQSPDLAPATANPVRVPAGTLVLPMDNAGQRLNGQFNLKAYGLAVQLLNHRVPLRWVMRAGKGKDEADFTALAAQVLPGPAPATSRAFAAGPLLVLPRDTAGVRALAAAFNASQGTAVALYQLHEAATVDVRYVLNQKPVAAILNDGGNAAIHQGYMHRAGISGNDNVAALRSQDNYATQVAVDLDGQTDCFTFASEPHSNNTAGGVVEAIRRFVARGGNFLAECEAVVTYENYGAGQAGGHFQTSAGIADADVRDANPRRYPAPDQPLVQFEGSFRASVLGGSVTNWRLASGSAFANGGQAQSRLASPSDEVLEVSAADLYAGRGGVVSYVGGHQFAGTTEDDLNGQRLYLNAFLVPATTFQGCNVFADAAGNSLATALRYTICRGDSVRLVVPAGASAETYAWSPATGLRRATGASVQASPASTTTYTVAATSASGTRYVGVTVVVLDRATLSLARDGCPALVGQELTFQPTPSGLDLSWDFGDGSPASIVPRHAYARPGRYTVLASDPAASGCPVQASLAVEVSEFRVPNVFTPNGDGRNDTFELPGLPSEGASIQIFSRWGQRVYATDHYANDWAGAGLAAGIYYYLLQLPGCATPVKGWVEIVR